MPKFKFEAHKLESILKEYAELREVEVPKAVLMNGRLLAKELMRRTQPFGLKQDAGEKRVEYDINKVVKYPVHVLGMIAKVETKKIRDRLRSLYINQKWDIISRIFSNIGYLKKWGEFESVNGKQEIKEIHQKNRNSRTGRTFNRADKLYITSSSELAKYIDEVAKRVGTAKAGWAEAANALPSVVGRGNLYDFPEWVTRNMRGNGSVKNDTANTSQPTVTLTNSTPWIDRILPVTEQMNARSIVISRMKTQMANILKKRKKATEAAA